jgi:hypothetical protein
MLPKANAACLAHSLVCVQAGSPSTDQPPAPPVRLAVHMAGARGVDELLGKRMSPPHGVIYSGLERPMHPPEEPS